MLVRESVRERSGESGGGRENCGQKRAKKDERMELAQDVWQN